MNPTHYTSWRRGSSEASSNNRFGNNVAEIVILNAEPVRPWLDVICFPKPIYFLIHLMFILVALFCLCFFTFRYHEAYEIFAA